MSSPKPRSLTALVACAGIVSVVLAQNAPAPTREEALAEVRKSLATCEALPDTLFTKQGCVAQCSRALALLPNTPPERIPSWIAGCNSGVRAALHFHAQAEQAAELQKAAQARAANEQAQAAKAAAAITPSAATYTKPTLRVDGAIDWSDFENDLTFYRVFNGEFDSYRDGSLGARALLTFYLEGFEDLCGAFLPPDSVTIVRKTFLVERNAYGFERRTQTGITEIRMAPRFVDGYENYSAGQGMAAFVDIQRPDRMVKDAIEFLKSWRKDTDLFFGTEACQGATMLQMGENLARLTTGRKPLQAEPNAAQILANLRVRVPQGVEEADIRAKGGTAAVWWNEQRAHWGNPPQSRQYDHPNGGGGQISIKYEAIPPDFRIPIPESGPLHVVQIDVGKSYFRRVRSIRIGYDNLAPADISRFGPNADTYRKDTRAALDERARTLRCTYDAGGTLNTVEYWYRKNPQTLNLDASRTTWPKHPLLQVRSARSDCPVVMP